MRILVLPLTNSVIFARFLCLSDDLSASSGNWGQGEKEG